MNEIREPTSRKQTNRYQLTQGHKCTDGSHRLHQVRILLGCLCLWLHILDHRIWHSEARQFKFCRCSRDVSAPGPSYEILDKTCYYRTPLCQILIPN